MTVSPTAVGKESADPFTPYLFRSYQLLTSEQMPELVPGPDMATAAGGALCRGCEGGSNCEVPCLSPGGVTVFNSVALTPPGSECLDPGAPGGAGD